MKTKEHSVLMRAGRPLGVAVLLSAVVGLVLIAFAWPAVNSAPRDVPVGVVAPAAAAGQVEQRLEQSRPGAFEVHRFSDQASGEDGVRDREVYGLIVLTGAESAKVVTASGASPAIAQALTQLAGSLSGTPPAPAKDLAPLPADDPAGASLTASMLPLLLGGILTTVVLARVASNLWIRTLAVTVAAGASGMVVALVLHTWLGALGGGFWSVAGVAALGIAGVGLALTGLNALAGYPGLGVGAATMMLLGNPLSGVAAGPEMLPSGWGTFGQLLPPGAYGSAMRSIVYFDGAAVGRPLLVLGAWVLLGVLLVLLAAARTRSAGERAAAPEAVAA